MLIYSLFFILCYDISTYDATPCLCPDGWEGKHCEFKRGSVPACTLDCRNEGVCEIGIRTPAEAEQMHHIWSSNEIDEHMQCLCLDDYGGPLCEAHAEICGDDICYHGGTCVETEINNSGVVTREYHCDCTTASDENSHLFAGKYCQHESTQFCSETDENLFCTNGGTCNTEDPFQGCDCPDGWVRRLIDFDFDLLRPHSNSLLSLLCSTEWFQVRV